MPNMKIYVAWKKSVVFAGDNIECTISIKNESVEPSCPDLDSPHQGRRLICESHDKMPTVTCDDGKGPSSPLKSSLLKYRFGDLQVGSQQSQYNLLTAGLGASRLLETDDSNKVSLNQRKHTRSVSIVSLGRTPSNINQRQDGLYQLPSPVAPQLRRHGRAASFQVSESDFQADNGMIMPLSGMSGPLSTTRTSTWTPRTTRMQSKEAGGRQIEKFIASYSEDMTKSASRTRTSSFAKRRTKPALTQPSSSPSQDKHTSNSLIPVSLNDTPRTSTDLNSPSNNSTETLASEYTRPSVCHPSARSSNGRQPSNVSPNMTGWKYSEVLMMGYACLRGSFTFDESLVNGALFEEVKRKGTIGWQGSGGVVGIESKKRDNGLLGNLGWNNLGESLGGLLKPAEPSSLRDVTGMAKTKAIPILTTPQTILFVDLRLKPGEAKKFIYSHKLPENIPPSHKGHALKVSYNLVVGIQRQQLKLQQHPVRHVEIPFRVLPSVDRNGDVMKYDLMSPYVQSRNIGADKDLGKHSKADFANVQRVNDRQPVNDPSGFTTYVDGLLSRPLQSSSLGLLSPTEYAMGSSLNTGGESWSAEEHINILTSQAHAWAKIGPSRYQIQRNGVLVGVILLSRPVFRLGESIPIVVDFQTAEVNNYSVKVYLESLESVDQAMALRPETNTLRATRKLHVSQFDYTSYGERLFFTTTIPINGTPDFVTSGVSLSWRLRFEFATVIRPADATGAIARKWFMEELSNDDRGRTLIAEEETVCEGFEISVPVRVLGVRGCYAEQPTPSGFPV